MESYVGNSMIAQLGIGQIITASFQTSLPNPVSHGTSLAREQTMQMAYRNAGSGRDRCRPQSGLRQVFRDEILNPEAQFLVGVVGGVAVRLPAAQARRQNIEICFDDHRAFSLS